MQDVIPIRAQVQMLARSDAEAEARAAGWSP
jgi:hypothetical protein